MDYFQEEDYNTPFLGSNLFDFLVSSYSRFASESNSEIEFFAPQGWNVELKKYQNILNEFDEDYCVFFLTDVFSVPISDFTKEDYQFLIQNPNKVFSHSSGTKIGYVNKNVDFSKVLDSDDLTGFRNLIRLSSANFLSANQALVNNFSSSVFTPGNYGNPVVLSSTENIHNSRIMGPSFIGEDVKISNSVIYPGSIIMGNCSIVNSEVFESFICESSIKNSVIKNSISALGFIDEVHLENSVIPSGSVLNNVRKR